MFSVEEVARRGIAPLPKTLDRALDELVADDVLRAELDAYHSTVSETEIDSYLTLM